MRAVCGQEPEQQHYDVDDNDDDYDDDDDSDDDYNSHDNNDDDYDSHDDNYDDYDDDVGDNADDDGRDLVQHNFYNRFCISVIYVMTRTVTLSQDYSGCDFCHFSGTGRGIDRR